MGCRKRNIRKDDIEAEVLQTLRDVLTHPELLADIEAWAADYYKNELGGSSCIGSLRAELKETETALSNILKAIEAGIFNDRPKTVCWNCRAANRRLRNPSL